MKNILLLIIVGCLSSFGSAWADVVTAADASNQPVAVTGPDSKTLYDDLVGLKAVVQDAGSGLMMKKANVECLAHHVPWSCYAYGCTLTDLNLSEGAAPIELFTYTDCDANPDKPEAMNLYGALGTAAPQFIKHTGIQSVAIECVKGQWESDDICSIEAL